jgi:hypothetical protein
MRISSTAPMRKSKNTAMPATTAMATKNAANSPTATAKPRAPASPSIAVTISSPR